MGIAISVIIPLYNKEREIEATLRSVLSQQHPPYEIIVVDDGSTDRSAEIASAIAAQNPLVRIVRQLNAGVSAARNKGIKESSGGYIALLDADDTWEPGYLAEVERLIADHPGCGMYCMGFNVKREDGLFPNETIMGEGVVEDYFRTALKNTITHTSGATIPRHIFDSEGGFPEGMKLGEDLYMWAKIASRYPVCYCPKKLYTFDITSHNRSVHGYAAENTSYSFRDLYREEDYWLNEYIARAEIGRATVQSINGYTREARSSEKFFRYTHTYRRGWWRLWMLNRLPVRIRPAANNFYRRLAWLLAGKGKMG